MPDLTGRVFGELKVLEYAGRSASNDRLKSGVTQSCGCLRRETARERATKHGGANDPLYHVLSGMHQRCENPKNKDYKYYGAEGVRVCAEWALTNYSVFKSWAEENGYAPGLTIDRIDPHLNYSPDNCRWITISEQQSNRRSCKIWKDRT